jgi:UDP-MurNAc hydroxylase
VNGAADRHAHNVAMEFRILSHAALWVRCGGTSVVIDPWLVGSCYWRSWWNFPRAVFDERDMAAVDAVIVSHLHWDHWHGPSLRKLFAGKPVLIPDEPHQRSARDLHTIGFRDVRRLPHGKSVELGALRITLYQFGRFVNDSAIVIEGDGVTLLNANDAKIAGWPLRQLVARHGPIDFAFRSHSSANARVCWRLQGDSAHVFDDHGHYMRSFVQFMDAVQPRHAVPFASNHCHLHDDVFAFNEIIATPLELREHVRGLPPRAWNLQVMLPGSHWQGSGNQPGRFELAPETPYEDRPAALRAYRAEQAPALERYRQQENAVVVGDALLERFLDYFRAPGCRPPAPLGAVKLVLYWPDGRRQAHAVDTDRGTVAPAAQDSQAEPGLPMLEMPAIVFRDAVIKNMFGHAGISKRCAFVASNHADLNRLGAVVAHLDQHELGRYPASWAHRARLVLAYVRRWRELVVYAQALWLLKVKRLPIWLVEEAILERSAPSASKGGSAP